MLSLRTLRVVVVIALCVEGVVADYCRKRSDPCWPEDDEFRALRDSLDGTAVLPTDAQYPTESRMKNMQYDTDPAIIVQVASIRDVQKAIDFVRMKNLLLTIFSSGHDFNGRSTGDNSLQISMVLMQKIVVNLHDWMSDTGASVTVQTGNSWKRIYLEMDRVGKVVVGGSAHTISPGGYTAGGGHSPLSRSLGLAVDNLLAVTMVLANGSLVQLYPWGTNITEADGSTSFTDDADLFWAISGGGGGTFGIVIDYKFKIHNPPQQLVQFMAMYPMDLDGDRQPGLEVIRNFHSLLPDLPPQWGGYIVHFPRGEAPPSAHPLAQRASGYIFLFMLHYGAWNTQSRANIDPLANFRTDLQLFQTFVNHSSFWSYEKDMNDPEYYLNYVANSLIPQRLLTPKLAEFYADHVLNPPYIPGGASATCVETLIGGKTSLRRDDAISEGFREALLATSCSIGWTKQAENKLAVQKGKEMAEEFYEHSAGVYLNEAAYDLPKWRSDFWGDKYDRLLSIKEKHDPHNLFHCRHCVGDDGILFVVAAATICHHATPMVLVLIATLTSCYRMI